MNTNLNVKSGEFSLRLRIDNPGFEELGECSLSEPESDWDDEERET